MRKTLTTVLVAASLLTLLAYPWGEEVPGDGGHWGHDMAGMMTDEEMADLEGYSESEFDLMFLTMMIEHHEGAIEMAETEHAEGESPDALALAEEIKSAQTEEVQTMQELLKS